MQVRTHLVLAVLISGAFGIATWPTAADCAPRPHAAAHHARRTLSPAQQLRLARLLARWYVADQGLPAWLPQPSNSDACYRRLERTLGHEPRDAEALRFAYNRALPRLQAQFADRLRVDASDERAQRMVASTLLVPDSVLRRLAAAGVSVHIGTAMIVVNGSAVEGDGRTQLPGAFFWGEERLEVDSDGVSESSAYSLVLHEVGHAIDAVMGLDGQQQVNEAQIRLGPKMGDYYYQPDDLVDTRREFVAETVGWYLSNGYAWFCRVDPALAAAYRQWLGWV